MPKTSLVVAMVVVLIIGLAVLIAYKNCKLGFINKHLPAKLRKTCPNAGGFVGAFGRSPEMENCHAWNDSRGRWSNFNRCTWA
jgi:hypothetical protein